MLRHRRRQGNLESSVEWYLCTCVGRLIYYTRFARFRPINEQLTSGHTVQITI